MTEPRSASLVCPLCLASALGLLACETAPEPAAAPAPQEPSVAAEPDGKQADTAEAAGPAADGLSALDGPAVLAAIRAGKSRGVLVNVWASWCGNCKKEMPMLLSVADAVAEHGIGLMLVSADEPGKRAAAATFLDEFAGGRQGFIVSGRLGPFKRALHPTWKGSIPSTFLFDQQGTLRHTWLGPVYEHELQPVLQAFLAGTLEGDGLGLKN